MSMSSVPWITSVLGSAPKGHAAIQDGPRFLVCCRGTWSSRLEVSSSISGSGLNVATRCSNHIALANLLAEDKSNDHMKNLSVPLTLLFSASALLALQPKATLDCNNEHDGGSRAHFCEMREQTVSAAGLISVDASQNGGISIKGWDRNDVLVRAQVRAQAPTDDQARDLVRQINIQSGGGQVKAYGPTHENERDWSVSYEIFVPSHISANLETVNGGVSVSDVNGNLECKTVNGGLSLHRVGGLVRGHTTNGGVSVELGGDRWDGQGLEVTTTNGGVSLRVPQNYSAQLEAHTSNGGVHLADLPVQSLTHSNRPSHDVSTAIGNGGALLKVTTTNGGVSLTRI